MEALGRAILENEICRAVVVDELPDVAAFLAQGAEALQVLVVAVDRVAGGHAHSGQAVSAVVEVHVHYILFVLFVVEDLGALQDPTAQASSGWVNAICLRKDQWARSFEE